MGTLYRITRIHDILVIIFTDQLALFKIFDIASSPKMPTAPCDSLC